MPCPIHHAYPEKGTIHMKSTASPHLLRLASTAAILTLGLGLGACSHKAAPPPPAPPAPTAAAPAPTITLQANTTAIESGAGSTLTWTSSNAARVELNGSPVNLNGSQAVTPTQSTAYQIVAKSADGQTSDAAVRITVSQPAAPEVAPSP